MSVIRTLPRWLRAPLAIKDAHRHDAKGLAFIFTQTSLATSHAI
jgi:hypothetical protein